MNNFGRTKNVSPERRQKQASDMAWRIALQTGDYVPNPGQVWAIRIVKFIGLAGVALPAFFGFVFYLIYSNLVVPTPEQVPTGQASTVYYSDGESVIAEFAPVKREIVDTQELPSHVTDILVHSIDPEFETREAGSFWDLVVTATTPKGSFTSEGVAAKYTTSYYSTYPNTRLRRIENTLLRLKIERDTPREDLAGYFVNTAYFGRGAYGIEAASRAYFGHDSQSLTIAETLVLAGVIQADNPGDPERNTEFHRKAWEERKNALIAEGKYANLLVTAEYPTIKRSFEHKNATWGQSAGHIMNYVRQELLGKDMTREEIETGGLKIITSLDLTSQQAAIKAAKNLDKVPGWTSAPNRFALVELDTKNSMITSMYAGNDYHDQPVNTVTQMSAPVGPAMLPYLLIANDQSQGSINDVYPTGAAIEGDDAAQSGITSPQEPSAPELSLSQSIRESSFPALLRANTRLGAAKLYDAAAASGIPMRENEDKNDIRNTLGATPASAFDIAQAFAVISTGGRDTEYHMVKRVEDKQEHLVFKHDDAEPTSDLFSAETLSAIYPALKTGLNVGPARPGVSDIPLDLIGMTGPTYQDTSGQLIAATPERVLAISLFRQDDKGQIVPLAPLNNNKTFSEGYWQTKVFADYVKEAWKESDEPVQPFPWYTPVDRPSTSYLPEVPEPEVPAVPVPETEPEPDNPTETPEAEPTTEEEVVVEAPGVAETPAPAPQPAPAPVPEPVPAPQPAPVPVPEPEPAPPALPEQPVAPAVSTQ